MKIRTLGVLVALALFTTTTAWTAPLTFNFGCGEITSSYSGSCPGNLKTNTATFTSSGLGITAKGYSSTGTSHPNNLYVFSTGGLGLAGGNNEIQSGDYIYLNLSNLVSDGILSGTLELEDVTSSTEADVCTTSAVGTPGSTCVEFTNPPGNGGTVSGDDVTMPITWTATDDILSITVPTTCMSGEVVLDSLTVNTDADAPEPSSLLLFGTMLIALALVYRRFPKPKSIG